MRPFWAAFLVLAVPSAVVSTPAYGCSFSWKKGWAPEEIKRRADVRKLEGVFRLEEVLGERHTDEDGTEWIWNAEIVGSIESKGGQIWNTIHDAPDDTTTCRYGSYFKPESDAKGAFWITRSKKSGRYRILLWEGDYLRAEEKGSTED